MQEPLMDITAARRQALADQYAALRFELSALHAQPFPDLVAIDTAIKNLDAVQMELKAMTSRADDPQRF